MKEARQRYYAALEHESAAQRLFDGHESQPGAAGFVMGDTPAAAMGVPDPADVYSELGMQVYRAIESLLGNVSGWARSGGGDGAFVRRAVAEALQPLMRDVETLRSQLERHELLLNEIAAGIRRIDRFTLEAFQRMRERGSYAGVGNGGSAGSGRDWDTAGTGRARGGDGLDVTPPKRLAKEETVARALEAARELKAQGRKLTLKSVAEAAGLKYSQIVYAFGSKDEMLSRVMDQDVDVANAS